jgi:hypothetical protein
VLRNVNTGAFEVYDIAGNALVGAASLGQVGLDWQLGGFAVDRPMIQALANSCKRWPVLARMQPTSDGVFLGDDTSQQSLLTTPQHIRPALARCVRCRYHILKSVGTAASRCARPERFLSTSTSDNVTLEKLSSADDSFLGLPSAICAAPLVLLRACNVAATNFAPAQSFLCSFETRGLGHLTPRFTADVLPRFSSIDAAPR